MLGSRRTMSRILVIDDNHDSASMLAELLARRGHAVDVAHDGLVAYDMILEHHPEVAVIDIGLATIDGREAGFETHLTKPVQLGKLLALLDHTSPTSGA